MLYHMPFPTANALTVNRTSQQPVKQLQNFCLLFHNTIDCEFI